MIKFSFAFLWFDFWIGWYFDTKNRILYICPLPCCVFKFWREDISCQYEGCKSTDTIKCTIAYENDISYYCPEHAAKEGFCCCCGLFCAGMESFDFVHPGFCDNCYDEVRDDWEDEDGFNFFDDDYEPMQEYSDENLEIEEVK